MNHILTPLEIDAFGILLYRQEKGYDIAFLLAEKFAEIVLVK